MHIRETIYSAVTPVAKEQKLTLPPLTDDIELLTALDSLSVAVLVAKLEDTLRLDPFGRDDVEIPVTLGDLVRLYETAAANADA